MKKVSLIFLSLGMIIATQAWCMGPAKSFPPLDTVPRVNLTQYLGQWYEIARLPQWFEKDCVGVTAEYTLREDSQIDVKNSCKKKTCDGPSKIANGVARVVDAVTLAQLKVSFFWPFEGDYWILELGPNYSYSVVGSPDRKTFWILSRTPTLAESTIQDIIQRFTQKGFNLNPLERTTPCEVTSSPAKTLDL
jgi:apolipoprotein D and lipocalin family protein